MLRDLSHTYMALLASNVNIPTSEDHYLMAIMGLKVTTNQKRRGVGYEGWFNLGASLVTINYVENEYGKNKVIHVCPIVW